MANPVVEALTPFIWGAGGAKKTPEEIARDREVAADILMRAGNTSPVGHWTQGAARVVDALGGVLKERRANAAGEENSAYNSDILNSLLGGGSSASSSVPMTSAAGEVAATSPAVAGSPEAYRNAIASIESAGSGDYSAVGPTNPKLGRALGRYQIMEANIGPWAQEALGRPVTADEFLADPKLQDAIFDKKFGSYVQQYGPEGAAQAWFAGPGGVGKTDRSDVLGTTVGEYASKFRNALGPEVAAATPEAAIEAVAPASGYVDPQVSAAPPLPAPVEVAPAPAVAEAPQQQIAQALTAPTASPTSTGINPEILRALSDPRATRQTRAIAEALMQQQMEQNDPLRQLQLQEAQIKLQQMRNPQPEYEFITGKDGSVFRADKRTGNMESVYGGKPDLPTNVQEYEYAKQQGYPGSFQDFQLETRRAGASQVNIDQKAEGAFDKKLAEKQAETFDTMATEGMNARADLGVINELEGLLQGQGGTLTGLAGVAAKYGIGGEGMGDLQAAQALINKLIPSQRQPGSGSMSDRDVEMFTRSLPSLWNQPGGNAKIINVMRSLTKYKQEQGEIADQVITGDMTRQEARRALRSLPNPLEEFRNQGQQKKPAVIDGYTIEEAD